MKTRTSLAPRPRRLPYMILSGVALTLSVAAVQPALAQKLETNTIAAEMPGSFADLVENLSPAVVNISTKQKITAQAAPLMGFPFEPMPGHPGMEQFQEFFEQFNRMQAPQEREVTSLGSGFVVDAQGYIITNHHVISGADQILVRFSDDTELEAKLVGNDPKTDLALLKVTSSKPLAYVPLGDSDKARVGDWVIAIGNPFGLGGTVTAGIISARQRSINAGPYDDFIQTDASINRGNSGGPLFNTKGEVIGINSAIFSPTGGSVGIGFAIPTSLAKPIIDQLKQYGKAHRGWLGVKIQEVTPEVANSVGLKEARGALIVDVTNDSPAAKAGILAGDIITHLGGNEVKEMRILPRMVAESGIGKKTEVTIWRQGKSKTLQLVIAEMQEDESASAAQPSAPEGAGPENAKQLLGLSVVELNEKLRKSLGMPAQIKGVMVVEVDPASEASRRGLRRGDVLTEVNNSPVTDLPRFERLLSDAKKAGREFVLMRVLRGKDAAFITMPLE